MTEAKSPGALTQLLIDSGNGDERAREQLLPLVSAELRRLAGGYISRERPHHTLQPTAFVHEAYLWKNPAQFVGLAAVMKRRILVNHARDRAAAKRGGYAERVSLGSRLPPSWRTCVWKRRKPDGTQGDQPEDLALSSLMESRRYARRCPDAHPQAFRGVPCAPS